MVPNPTIRRGVLATQLFLIFATPEEPYWTNSFLAPDAPLVMGVPAPDHIEPKLARVTLAPRILPAAGTVLVMSAGESKADVIAAILNGPRDPARLPAQTAILPNATWLLDEAVATGVSGD